ncbi:PTS sugar transporter subunit IIA [Lactobacillus pentosus]|jgi:PTS system fructose-specific IIA component|nr:PTS sugar transporter subunit IIA [Lactiplantibacillus pentosus]AYG42647.1 PTS sugar transporter subunit IIA [Lactiplantibacillus pentosus]MCT3292030.1 PTS sugar transporter subunit IIA [Lactiplantibacillus pentosus]MCT3305101.1 PTS sugar transporter subunit IIA [Lactiplantibacillus pentosus]MCT3309419.1 PTS sugar transporter subunit IIA [Lactiplantibacillus pentosus]
MNKEKVAIVTRLQLDAVDKKTAIKQIVEYLKVENFVTDKAKFIKEVFERENILPTYIGHEIGLPHSQSDSVSKPVVAIGRLMHPIVWNDENKVKLIFLIAVPKKHKDNIHLKIIAKLSRMLMHEDFRQILLVEGDEKVREIMLKEGSLIE